MFVRLHRVFVKKFEKLHPKLREKFKERKDLFLENPVHQILNNQALHGDRAGQWSINITGDLRAVYTFQADETILFVDIDTHSNLYT